MVTGASAELTAKPLVTSFTPYSLLNNPALLAYHKRRSFRNNATIGGLYGSSSSGRQTAYP